jgi:hypothetical protein
MVLPDLRLPSPVGLAGSKVLGPECRGSSDFRGDGSAGLETPIALWGEGVTSPSGFEKPTVLGGAVSKYPRDVRGQGSSDLRC